MSQSVTCEPPVESAAICSTSPDVPVAGKRVLFVQHCANFTGSTISGKLAAEGLVEAGWSVDVAFGFDGLAHDWYREAGCRTRVAPHRSWLRGGNGLQSSKRIAAEVMAARRFQRIIRETSPDLVYVNSLVSLAAAVAAKREKVPLVWHVRELFDDVGGEMRAPAWGGKALVQRTLGRLADRLVAISKAVAENAIGVRNAAKTTIVPNAVDAKYFSPRSREESRRRFGLPLEAQIIGVPGTLRPMKGHPFFLEAAALVHASNPECLFAITGDGEPNYREELKRLATEAGLADRVRWLGTVSEMPDFYAACDVVCIPSRAEPFGRTVIEAFAGGAPVVASAVGGICETVAHGENGLLVEYGDAPAMSTAILQLMQSEVLRKTFSTSAMRKATELYSSGMHQKLIVNVASETVDSISPIRWGKRVAQ